VISPPALIADTPAVSAYSSISFSLPRKRSRPIERFAMPGGKAAKIHQRRRGKHALAGVAAGLLQACRGIHGVAEECDLHFNGPEFADGDWSAMQSGAEIGPQAKVTNVGFSALRRREYIGPQAKVTNVGFSALRRREYDNAASDRGRGARCPAGISFADVMYFTFAIVQAFSTLYACGGCAGRFGVPHWVLSPKAYEQFAALIIHKLNFLNVG